MHTDDDPSLPGLRRRSGSGIVGSRGAGWRLCALALGVLGCGEGDTAAARPNVLLISIDTLRADHLGCYGYARDTSPRIDALAREGALYERCWSTTSWTLPAHLSLLTGEFISAHGVCDDRLWGVVGKPDGPERLPMCGTFLPELLQDAGYDTAGFVSGKYLESRFGFGPGFDHYERTGRTVFSDVELAKRFAQLRSRGDEEAIERWRAEEPLLFTGQRPTAGETVDTALEWLGARLDAPPDQRAPFFLFVHLFDVHDGYVPPAPFDALFTDPAYSGPIDGNDVSTPNSPVVPDMAPADLAQLIALYDGEIAWTDSQVGRLLDFLDARGVARDTLVVLTADHGEEFFEHGMKRHRYQLYPESLCVPLVWRWPARIRAGARIEANAGLVDVVPTVCELLGLPQPPGVNGASLASELGSGRAGAPREYLSELVRFDENTVIDRRLSLVRGDEQVLCETPPGQPTRMRVLELGNAALARAPGVPIEPGSAEALDLEQRIDAWRNRIGAARCPPEVRRGEAKPLSEEEQAELSQLGYTQSDEPALAGDASERLCLDGCVWPDP